MTVEYIASQSSDAFATWHDWWDAIFGFMFLQVVQRH